VICFKYYRGNPGDIIMSLDKTIRAMQFIAKPAVRYTTQAVAKVAEHAVPRTKEFIDTWNREWNKGKPTIVHLKAKPTSSEEPGDVGICNICTGPYVDGACTTYKCWR
jgi:hypothetical protein